MTNTATTTIVQAPPIPVQHKQRAPNRHERRRARALCLLACLSLLAAPARALDCRTVPPLAVGQPLTEDQARCLSAVVITDTLARETCEAELVASRVAVDACEATAQITCPPPRFPVVEVSFAAIVGVVVGVVATVALVLR